MLLKCSGIPKLACVGNLRRCVRSKRIFFSFSKNHQVAYQVFGCGWGYQREACSGWGGDWAQTPGEGCTSWRSSSTARRRPALLALQLLPAFVCDLNTQRNTPRERHTYMWEERGRGSRASQRQVAENTRKTRNVGLMVLVSINASPPGARTYSSLGLFSARFPIPFQTLIMTPRPDHLLDISLLGPCWCSGTTTECFS